MKPAPFDYTRPADLPGALQALAGAGARALAGGQSLGPMLNLRLARPSLLVDLGRIAELRRIERNGDALVLGAMTTHASIEDGAVPDTTRGMLRRVAADIAYRAVRTRGTMGGSLAHADPAADWVTALTALDATLTIRRAGGGAAVPMRDFMTGAFATALGEGTVLASIAIPTLSAKARWGYYKICRKPGEFADAIGAVVLDPARDYRRVVMGAVGGAPIVLDALAARLPYDGTPALTRADIASGAPAMDDVDRQIHVVAVERALAQAYAA